MIVQMSEFSALAWKRIACFSPIPVRSSDVSDKGLDRSVAAGATSSRYLDVELGRGGAPDVVGIRRKSLANGSARPAILLHNLAAASGI